MRKQLNDLCLWPCLAASTLYSLAVRAFEVGNWGLTGTEGSAMGAAGLTGAGAGAGGGAIVCGGVLQPVSHKATMHAVQAKCEDFRKWAMA